MRITKFPSYLDYGLVERKSLNLAQSVIYGSVKFPNLKKWRVDWALSVPFCDFRKLIWYKYYLTCLQYLSFKFIKFLGRWIFDTFVFVHIIFCACLKKSFFLNQKLTYFGPHLIRWYYIIQYYWFHTLKKFVRKVMQSIAGFF